MKEIGASLHTADKQNDRAKLTILSCALEGTCPLLQAGMCQHATILGPSCPYGRYSTVETHTKAARAYCKEVSKLKERRESLPAMPNAPKNPHVSQVGEYIYWPYGFLIVAKEGKIEFDITLFSAGNAFIKKEDFTLDFILRAVEFRPQALMGGEIKDYQEKTMPKMLLHLSIMFPDMWEQLPEGIRNRTFVPDASTKVSYRLSNLPNGLCKIGRAWGYWNGKEFRMTEKSVQAVVWSSVFSEIPGEFNLTVTIDNPEAVEVVAISDEMQREITPDYVQMVKEWKL